MKTLINSTALALAMALGLGVPAATAQQTGGDAAAERQDFSDEKLGSFVQAADAIRSVMDDFRPQLENVETSAERDQLRQEINDEILAAVEATPGINIDEYVAIARQARNDSELESRIRDMMQEQS